MRRQLAFVRIDAVLALRNSKFFEPALEVVPRFDGFFFRRAFRLGLIGAEEDVAAGLGNRRFLRDFARDVLGSTVRHASALSCLVRDGLRGAGDRVRIAEIEPLDGL